MKILISYFLFLISTNLFANNIEIIVDPEMPVKGSSFNLHFKITTDDRSTPFINFNPQGAEVMGKVDGGVSIFTTLINGKFKTKRTLNYTYELMPKKSGNVIIKNITIDIGIKKTTLPNKIIKVLSQKSKPKDIFLLAIPSKKDAFVGEGIDVNYYIYSRVSLIGKETKKLPKLNKFIKRFYNVQPIVETVEYSGAIYRRSLEYSARVFPESQGKALIDSLVLKVQYSNRTGNVGGGLFGFGGFGMRLQTAKTKTIVSRPVEINIKPLPTKNLPKNFTGLVGKHEFSLNIQKNKFLTNEAIEVRFTVEGPGALEKLESPIIYSHKFLEEFDVKNEVSDISKNRARKVFDFTFLARATFVLKERDIELYYFDPEKEKYMLEKLRIPPLIISGKSTDVKPSSPDITNKKSNSSDAKTNNSEDVKLTLTAPIFLLGFNKWSFFRLEYINYFLFFILLISIIFAIISYIRSILSLRKGHNICNKLKKNGISYENLYKLFLLISGDNELADIKKTISNSNLSSSAKKYFYLLYETVSANKYGNKKLKTIKYNSNYFRELLSLINK